MDPIEQHAPLSQIPVGILPTQVPAMDPPTSGVTHSAPHPQVPMQGMPEGRVELSSPDRNAGGSPIPINEHQEIYCKLLLSNILAGSLIGKSGTTISNIRQKSGANIRISNVANAYSPERLALISGVKDAMASALEQVVELGAQPFGENPTTNTENGIMMKVIIPKSSVSLLIGKGGQRINDMRQMTGSRIHVSTKEESPIPTAERIVKILGSDVPGVAAALLMVIVAIQSDPQVKDQHTFGHEPNAAASHLLASHSSPMGHHYGGGNPAMMSGFNMSGHTMDYVRLYGMDPWMTERSCEIFMQVPDAYVGMLVGKSGQHITDIKLSSNAKIEISKKGDFVEGTNDRLVTISGSIMSTHAAHARLMKRIMELQQQDTPARSYHKGVDLEVGEQHYYQYN